MNAYLEYKKLLAKSISAIERAWSCPHQYEEDKPTQIKTRIIMGVMTKVPAIPSSYLCRLCGTRISPEAYYRLMKPMIVE